jgi:hypothetical protein
MPGRRRLHCIDKHGFPKEYDFYIVNDGIDKRNSMLRSPRKPRTIPRRMSRGGRRESGGRSRSSTQTSTIPGSSQGSKIDESPEIEMGDVTSKLSSLTIIPRSIKFGGKATPGFRKRDQDIQ